MNRQATIRPDRRGHDHRPAATLDPVDDRTEERGHDGEGGDGEDERQGHPPLAAVDVGVLKNSEPARATVTMASPPSDSIWVRASRLNAEAVKAS